LAQETGVASNAVKGSNLSGGPVATEQAAQDAGVASGAADGSNGGVGAAKQAAQEATAEASGAAGKTTVAPKTGLSLPGRIQSRINLSNKGWDHVVKRHFSGKPNVSQFTISQDELRGILQSKEFVKTPITRTLQSNEGTLYVREVDLGKKIGLDKFNSMNPTNVMSVVTDKFGNLKTVTPGIIK
jgi:filamentous hemagglutinin